MNKVNELISEFEALSGGSRQESKWLRSAINQLLEELAVEVESDQFHRAYSGAATLIRSHKSE